MEPGARLRELREAAGVSVEQLAQRVGKSPTTVRAHENGQNGIRPPMAQRYARELNSTPEWILYGRSKADQRLPSPDEITKQQLQIRYQVAAGAWLATDDVRDQPLGEAEAHWLPEYKDFQQWLEVVSGDSMDRLLPPGSLVHVVDAIGMGYAPRHGDLVVVVRRRAQGAFIERSIKQVELTSAGVELWPRSHNPRWSQPLEIRSGMREGEDAEVEIVGKVARAYMTFEG